MRLAMHRLWIQLSVDKRRFGAFMLVLTIGLLLWARIIIISNPPKRAVADDGSDPLAATGGSDDTARVQDEPDKTRLVVFLPDELDRDPFRISRTHFPKPTPENPSAEEVVELTGDSVDDQERMEWRRTALLQSLVEQFRLEAAINGGPAVIDGRAVRLGDSVTAAGESETRFKLIAIGSRSVTLECEGRRFELRMTSGFNDS